MKIRLCAWEICISNRVKIEIAHAFSLPLSADELRVLHRDQGVGVVLLTDAVHDALAPAVLDVETLICEADETVETEVEEDGEDVHPEERIRIRAGKNLQFRYT
ncbi:hypothetical protein GCK32_017110 [Trichostrongylus colubriformis]|uniref:Uncharacterized protein n=1 Tax=Trichostrongylus colubriformis TaxID=6319 RepID=A0AAN8FFR0_TRICO